MPSITVKHDVSDQFLADVLTTAIESGGHSLWYWEGFSLADIERAISRAVPASSSDKVEVMRPVDDPDPKGRFSKRTTLDHLSVYRIKFVVDHPQDQDEYTIDLEDVAKGIQWILDGTVPVAQRLVDMISEAVSSDDPDIDAEGADVIIQACAFKALVFG